MEQKTYNIIFRGPGFVLGRKTPVIPRIGETVKFQSMGNPNKWNAYKVVNVEYKLHDTGFDWTIPVDIEITVEAIENG